MQIPAFSSCKIQESYWRHGVSTLTNDLVEQVCATGVRFARRMFYVSLSDGREIGMPLDKVEWLKWLANVTQEQCSRWSAEPGGFAIHWEDLDDGIEVCRLLGAEPFA